MRLSDCFIEIIAYVSFLTRVLSAEQPSYEQASSNIQRLIAQSEASRERGRFSQEDFNLARFAVFAWVDETILASN